MPWLRLPEGRTPQSWMRLASSVTRYAVMSAQPSDPTEKQMDVWSLVTSFLTNATSSAWIVGLGSVLALRPLSRNLDTIRWWAPDTHRRP